jgi:hypothetical protein
MAPPFFHAHHLHLRVFHAGNMARILSLIVLLFAFPAWSQETCPVYTVGTVQVLTTASSKVAACQGAVGKCSPGMCGIPGISGTSGGVYDEVDGNSCKWHWTSNTGVNFPKSFAIVTGSGPCPDCSEFEGQKKGVKWPDSGVNPGSSLCKDVGGKSCTMTAAPVAVCLGGNCYNTYSYSGAGCSSAPPPPEVVEASDTEKGECIGVSSGTACVAYDRNAENCGTVNGQPLCLGKVPDGKCLFVGGAGVACDSSAGSPPAPDDGVTPGTPATPVTEIETRDSDGNVTNNYSVYSQSQVNNSTNGVTGSYADSTGTGSTSGDGEGEGEGGGSGSSSASCAVEPACEGDPIQCAILRQSWLSRCYEVVSEAEAGSLTGGPAGVGSETVEIGTLDEDVFGDGTGSCPADQEITVFGAVLALPWSFACQLAGYMRPLILLMAYLQSAYIVVGAFRNG